jgi:hypothetical protein
MPNACVHLDAVSDVMSPRGSVCEECATRGDRWVHLRVCQTCGATLCCDSSPNHHARFHARNAGHPVVASAEPGERWMYCYIDDMIVEY